jgi:hypothetical protein
MSTWGRSWAVVAVSVLGLTGCASGGAPSGQSAALPAGPAESSPHVISQGNRGFHEDYDRLLAAEGATLGASRALVVVSGFTVTLHFHGKETNWTLAGERNQTLKGLSHIPLGVVCFLLTLSQPALTRGEKDHLLALKKTIAASKGEITAERVGAEMVPAEQRLLDATSELIDDVLAHGRPNDERLHAFGKAIRADVFASLAMASGLLLGNLDSAVREMKAEVGAEAWPTLVAVILTTHQARAREVTVQYFERLLGDHLTEGALGEQRLVVLEGAPKEATAESTMTAHLVDQRLSSLLFDDPLFLQSDVLGKSAGGPLDKMFPRAAP